jgi:hypothetical protein
VAQLSAAGTQLVSSTYFGGPGGEQGDGISVDAFRNVYVVGGIESPGFATANAVQPRLGGSVDAFVAKMVGVTIDIRPGEFPNPINLRGGGVLPVAILSSPSFSARAVHPTSVTLGDPRLPGTAAPIRSAVEDVEGDGDLDLLLFFRIPDLVSSGALDASSREALLRGRTVAGGPIAASDSVRIVP